MNESDLHALPSPPLDPARAEQIRRRSLHVLRGSPTRAHPAEWALVSAFSVLLLLWATAAVVVHQA